MTTAAPPQAVRAAGSRASGWRVSLERHEWLLLLGIAAIAAVARAGGLSSGTLYRDDAWVALTTRVPLGTAVRMVVTTPGFVLGERVWIGWFPHNLLADQLPTFVASVAGVVAVGRLARWWGLSAGASLLAAGVVAAAYSDVAYATRIKPYAFDLLGACLLLWLAERVRRGSARSAPWLAVASIAVCAFSLTPVPLVVGLWAALSVEALVRRRLDARLLASGAVAALGLLALWLAVRPGISPRLQSSWDGYYLDFSSVHALAHSARTIVDGLARGAGDTTPRLGLRGLGALDRLVLGVLALLGLVRWRRQLLPIFAVVAAAALTVPRLVPLGTGRTDAYLYPALALLVAEGAALLAAGVRRLGRRAELVVLAVAVTFAGLIAIDRVAYRPSYPGGNLKVVAARLLADARAGRRVVLGGTVRWPWAYYEATGVRIRFSTLYNNGYTPLLREPSGGFFLLPGSAIEGGYAGSSLRAARFAGARCGRVDYVETDDWPSMPPRLLEDLEHVGRLAVTSGPTDLGGYRLWTLASVGPCLAG